MYEREYGIVENLYPEMIEMIKTVTGFERGTKNLPGLLQTAEYMTDYLKRLGCEVN